MWRAEVAEWPGEGRGTRGKAGRAYQGDDEEGRMDSVSLITFIDIGIALIGAEV
jgi:hypothetical protein